MNAYNLITGAVHAASGRFSDYWDFAKYIFRRYGSLPYEKTGVRSRLRTDIQQMTAKRVRVDQHSALEYLVARDLASADAELDRLPVASSLRDSLHNAYRAAIRILRDLGLEFAEPAFFVVDRFPEPYHEMDWVAFAPDKADQEDHGIKSGVYLLEDELSPYYSELTLAHELVHAVIGIVNPYLLGRGLEEGIAELVGELYIGSRLCSPRVARNVFIHTRLGSGSSQSNALYLDYTRQAFLIYRRFGLNGLAELIRGGRDMIKEVEARCLTGDTDALSLATGGWDETLTGLAENLLLGFVPNLVVSPLAVYIAEFATSGRTVEEVATLAQTEVEATREALEELQSRTFTLLLDEGKIAYSDLSFIACAGCLRYEVIL